MGVFEHINGDGYEQVVYCSDDDTGLRAIIAIHSTALGPALGGTRFWDYATEAEMAVVTGKKWFDLAIFTGSAGPHNPGCTAHP